jgi:hypothetical protein
LGLKGLVVVVVVYGCSVTRNKVQYR